MIKCEQCQYFSGTDEPSYPKGFGFCRITLPPWIARINELSLADNAVHKDDCCDLGQKEKDPL